LSAATVMYFPLVIVLCDDGQDRAACLAGFKHGD
jgi:hypothetical protein